MSDWIKTQCRECGSGLLINKNWVNPLGTCKVCRAKKVSNVVGLLTTYLNNRSKFDSRPIQPEDRSFMKKDIETRVRYIAERENLPLSDQTIEALYEASDGDCRRVINLLQASSSISPSITAELVNTLVATAKPADIKIVLEYALSGDFLKSKEKLLDVMLKESISGTDIIKSIQKEIWNLQIDDELKVRLTEKTGETEFRMTEGSDEFIQLESLLASFVLAGKGIVR